ncbi:MAG: hypothetical protein ACI88C_003144, partial [Acidimicrobiales bacterium]
MLVEFLELLVLPLANSPGPRRQHAERDSGAIAIMANNYGSMPRTD